MLVILSDLHLTDGTTGRSLAPGALRLFAERLADLACAASWRADSIYRPVERVDVVLLGDVLDPIRSARWNARPNVRPWGNPHAAELVDQVTRITADILQHNDESLAVLRQLASEGVRLRPATGALSGGAGEPAPVRIYYMVGNHDWFYHLPGPNYDALRQAIIERMGLANRPDRPFPHDMTESDELLQVMRRHKVCARHGDIYDPLNFEGDRDGSSLGDAIVIELVNRFAIEVESSLGGELPASVLLGLHEIDNIRPLLLVPVWLDGLLERACPLPAMRKRVKSVWDRLADEFLALEFVRRHDSWSPLDLVDGLERALKFGKRLTIGWAGAIAGWLAKIRGAASDSYVAHALSEQDFRNRRAKHIVYGHTHAAESVPLDASYAEGYVLEQVYFNTGTWRRVYRPTQLAPQEHEFIPSDVMSFAVFYQGDERKGRPFETWSGALGYRPPEVTIHRIDPGIRTHVPGQPIPPSSVPKHAPHFASLSAPPGPRPRRRN